MNKQNENKPIPVSSMVDDLVNQIKARSRKLEKPNSTKVK